jgi:ornithine cyclodeaminase
MRILNAKEVYQALPMGQAIAAMKEAYAAVSEGTRVLPQRLVVSLEDRGSMSAFMPAAAWRGDVEALGVKVVSFFPGNAELGKAAIQGGVLALDPSSGEIVALMEGGALTAVRTGAGSGAATDLLARPDSKVLAMIGTGGQAATQVEAVCTVRPIQLVRLFSLDPDEAAALAERIAGTGSIPADVSVAVSAAEAVRGADIISTATVATEPVFSDADIKEGAHINAIGAWSPEMCELPPETVVRALVVVDSHEAVLAEAGDLLQPMERGLIQAEHFATEIGQVIGGAADGRTSSDQITVFKSVGVGAQDVIAAHIAMQNAEALGLGQRVELL